MRTKTSTWFEVKVSYDKMMEDGSQKRVKEDICVDAMSFTEAEAAAYGEYEGVEDPHVEAEKIARYKEVIFTDNEKDDKWYKITVKIHEMDEKTGREKLIPFYHLLQSSTLESANLRIREYYDSAPQRQEYTVTDVNETKILAVVEHKAD